MINHSIRQLCTQVQKTHSPISNPLVSCDDLSKVLARSANEKVVEDSIKENIG